MFGRRTQVCGDEVVGVSAELVLRQTDDEALNRAGRKHQQQDAADELEEAVQPLEDDANFEGDVELGTFDRRLHSVNLSQSWRGERLSTCPGAPPGANQFHP